MWCILRYGVGGVLQIPSAAAMTKHLEAFLTPSAYHHKTRPLAFRKGVGLLPAASVLTQPPPPPPPCPGLDPINPQTMHRVAAPLRVPLLCLSTDSSSKESLLPFWSDAFVARALDRCAKARVRRASEAKAAKLLRIAWSMSGLVDQHSSTWWWQRYQKLCLTSGCRKLHRPPGEENA